MVENNEFLKNLKYKSTKNIENNICKQSAYRAVFVVVDFIIQKFISFGYLRPQTFKTVIKHKVWSKRLSNFILSKLFNLVETLKFFECGIW